MTALQLIGLSAGILIVFAVGFFCGKFHERMKADSEMNFDFFGKR